MGARLTLGVERQSLPSLDYTPGLAGTLQPGGGREEGDLHMIQLMVICGAISRPRTGDKGGAREAVESWEVFVSFQDLT